MTDNAIRAACAEAVGWKDINAKHGAPIGRPAHWDTEKDTRWFNLPDYLNDLNATHELEATLTKREILEYQIQLYRVASESDSFDGGYASWHYIHASARQRSESFLRTKGLWRSGQPCAEAVKSLYRGDGEVGL